ncbi:hypothetical protein CQW23_05620 [Capsicum baccatum]|uniref:Coiled-coil domain-containing protein 86 n=1 Tax=Capsicum baccatum TaxID=33114 RepID=A0A2G2XI03_CAPBA|nr:hypothetical protein CQW23_05620 [Capsicum baccatum]
MACSVDFRCLDEGFGGKTYKRKRAEKELNVPTEEEGEGMAMEVEASKRQADPGRPTYDGVIAGRVSGRNWKQPRKHRSSASKVSVKGKSLEQRMKEKEMKKAYRERMNELKEEIRQNKVNKRKHKEERDKKKQENILKSGTKVQKITNPKTLKKIAKSKQRKLLKVVSDQTKTIN